MFYANQHCVQKRDRIDENIHNLYRETHDADCEGTEPTSIKFIYDLNEIRAHNTKFVMEYLSWDLARSTLL